MSDIKPIRLFNIYGFTGMNYAGNVWDKEGLSPALLTMTGGNRQPLIMEGKMTDIKKLTTRDSNIASTIRASIHKQGSRNLIENYKNGRGYEGVLEMGTKIRIRKLTPTECYKLMGFTAEDCKKVSEGGISNSQLYKQAGNSIVVNVLEAIFKSLGEHYEEFKSANVLEVEV